MNARNNTHKAPLMALAAAALFGASTPLAKWLLGVGVSPWFLAALFYCGSGLGLGIVLLVRGRTTDEARLRRADLPWLLMVVLFGGVVAPVLLMIGLEHTSAASTSLLLNLEGLATMAIAWLVFREYVDRRLLLGAAAILVGSAVLTYQGVDRMGIGAFAITAACLCWGIDNNLTRKISHADPVSIAAIKGFAAGAINLALASAQHLQWPTGIQIAAMAAIGSIGYGVSLVLFVYALRSLGSARVSAYFSTAPFIGTLLAVVLLGEPISATLLIAAALMGVGVYLHVTELHRHEHTHETMEHEHRHTHDEHHQHEHGPNDPSGEPHAHWHRHAPLTHTHAHFPDLHHRHPH